MVPAGSVNSSDVSTSTSLLEKLEKSEKVEKQKTVYRDFSSPTRLELEFVARIDR